MIGRRSTFKKSISDQRKQIRLSAAVWAQEDICYWSTINGTLDGQIEGMDGPAVTDVYALQIQRNYLSTSPR